MCEQSTRSSSQNWHKQTLRVGFAYVTNSISPSRQVLATTLRKLSNSVRGQ